MTGLKAGKRKEGQGRGRRQKRLTDSFLGHNRVTSTAEAEDWTGKALSDALTGELVLVSK